MTAGEIQHKKMTETPIPKLILSLSVPTIISMLITVVYNTADTYFVSQINKSASAAVSACFAIMAVIQAIGFGFGMGSGSLISLSLGEKDEETASVYASSAFFASVFIGAVIGFIPLFFIKPVLMFLGCSDTMLPYAVPYALIIFSIAPVYCATFVLNNVLRAEGFTKFSMWGISAGGILNLVLDPIFIFTLKLGTLGAALATAIGQAVSFLILLFFFITKKSFVNISIKKVSLHFKTYILIVSTGLPTVFRQGLASVSSILLNVSAVCYGDEAVAAISIANKVYMLIRNIVIGAGQGFQPVAGYNFGNGNKKRTREAFSFTSIFGTVICLVSAVLIFSFSKEIMTWFCKDEDVIRIGITTLKLCALVIPFMAFSTYVNQLLQCLGFKASATFLASCRQGIFFIPIILILPKLIGINGVMMCQPLSDFLTFIISIPFIIVFYKKHLTIEKQNLL